MHPCHSFEIGSRFKTFISLLIQLHFILVCLWKVVATLESLFLLFWWISTHLQGPWLSVDKACLCRAGTQSGKHSNEDCSFYHYRQRGKWWLKLLINLFLLGNPSLISWRHQNPESTQPSLVCCFHSQAFQSIFEQNANNIWEDSFSKN